MSLITEINKLNELYLDISRITIGKAGPYVDASGLKSMYDDLSLQQGAVREELLYTFSIYPAIGYDDIKKKFKCLDWFKLSNNTKEFIKDACENKGNTASLVSRKVR